MPTASGKCLWVNRQSFKSIFLQQFLVLMQFWINVNWPNHLLFLKEQIHLTISVEISFDFKSYNKEFINCAMFNVFLYLKIRWHNKIDCKQRMKWQIEMKFCLWMIWIIKVLVLLLANKWRPSILLNSLV